MEKLVSMSPLPVEFIKGLINSKGIKDIEVVDASAINKEDMVSVIADAHYILGDFTFNQKITQDIVAAAKEVKLIQQPSVGYQHIDVHACKEAGIVVANTAGANTIAVAEHTVMSALCLFKNIFNGSSSTKSGEWKQLELKPIELFGKVWGIVGLGKIGMAVAERLRSFGLEIIYYDVNRLEDHEEGQMGIAYADISELLERSDVISLHCPLTEQTSRMINGEAIEKMKESAILINVSRGEVIDEEALMDALREKKIAGASLDVFEVEPLPSDHPFVNNELDHLILTPHVAGVSTESQLRIMSMTIDNLIRSLKGEKVENVIV